MSKARPAWHHEGVLSYTIECRDEEADLFSADLWEAGAVGVVEEDLPGFRRRLKGFFESKPDLPGPFEEVPDVDWEANFRAQWPPVLVGERLFLAPPWDETPTPSRRLRLTIHPGMALGSGDHPATRLCLAALETHVRPGDSVLDVGTGSGILADAAKLLGASVVVGCDIEPEAAAAAHANTGLDTFAGSLRAVAGKSFDIVVANINDTAIRSMWTDLQRVSRRLVIVSGFAKIPLTGEQRIDTLTEQDWQCLVCDAADSLPFSPPPPMRRHGH